jgi:hypothetical protein
MRNSEKAANRLTISIHDLECCQTYLEQPSKEQYGTVTYEALATIISYARLLSSNKRENANADSRVSVRCWTRNMHEGFGLMSELLEAGLVQRSGTKKLGQYSLAKYIKFDGWEL